ncbi:MAG: Gfo/Idh/MocA family oxidoreductase, partial [Candidatus Colwellbacteria bacterium]
MKFLIIGLGSMGKRRVRNLQALGTDKIIGFEPKEENRKEAEEKYGIKTSDEVSKINLKEVDAIIISTPPDKHNEWIEFAIQNKKPVFVEASVILKGLEDLNEKAKAAGVLIAPSATLRFHPAIKKIREIVESGKYGRVTTFSYHLGQYLPDWHPWEKVNEVYFGKKETSGSREMVAFELTWLTDIIGFPEKVTGFHGKTMDLGADIDDTYVISLAFDQAFGNLTIDVVARYAIRTLVLNMEQAQILWRWDDKVVKLYNANT